MLKVVYPIALIAAIAAFVYYGHAGFAATYTVMGMLALPLIYPSNNEDRGIDGYL